MSDNTRLPRIILPFTLAAATAAGLWGAGVSSPEWAVGIGAVSAAALTNKLGRTLLINKAAMATGALAFCLAMGMALPTSLGSLGLSVLAYTLKHPIGIMLAGFGGLLVSRMIRANWGPDRTHKRTKSAIKELAGTAAGISGFLGGTFAGAAASGSPHFSMDRINLFFENQGLWSGLLELNEQKNKILINAYEALNAQLSGAKNIEEWFRNIFEKATTVPPDQMEIFMKAIENPDIKAALIMLATSVAMAVPFYMGARHLTFRKEDYPGGLDKQP